MYCKMFEKIHERKHFSGLEYIFHLLKIKMGGNTDTIIIDEEKLFYIAFYSHFKKIKLEIISSQ